MRPRNKRPRYVLGTGFALSEPDADFDANKPSRACLLCGAVFQSTDAIERQLWAEKHKKTHTQFEHDLLAMSGLVMTAQAAHRLAAYGIIPLSDMVTNEEVEAALLEAPSQMTKEVEH